MAAQKMKIDEIVARKVYDRLLEKTGGQNWIQTASGGKYVPTEYEFKLGKTANGWRIESNLPRTDAKAEECRSIDVVYSGSFNGATTVTLSMDDGAANYKISFPAEAKMQDYEKYLTGECSSRTRESLECACGDVIGGHLSVRKPAAYEPQARTTGWPRKIMALVFG
ncbi:MAG: hypothetical protein KGI97_03600 [Alphaproteobacteria bacterium]|nr:hypothetical protein [Alphaproteobacteria bacterium]